MTCEMVNVATGWSMKVGGARCLKPAFGRSRLGRTRAGVAAAGRERMPGCGGRSWMPWGTPDCDPVPRIQHLITKVCRSSPYLNDKSTKDFSGCSGNWHFEYDGPV